MARNALSVTLLALLTGCTQNIWPGDELNAASECDRHQGLVRFTTSSTMTLNNELRARYAYVLEATCRDGSVHHIWRGQR